MLPPATAAPASKLLLHGSTRDTCKTLTSAWSRGGTYMLSTYMPVVMTKNRVKNSGSAEQSSNPPGLDEISVDSISAVLTWKNADPGSTLLSFIGTARAVCPRIMGYKNWEGTELKFLPLT